MTSNELAKKYHVSRGMITKVWYDANLKGKEINTTNYSKDDLKGKKINNLTVIEKTDERSASGCVLWLCKCDCGNYTKVISSRLRSGQAKSCGCLSKKALILGRGSNFQDLTGQNFGKLTVLKRCEDKIYNNRKLVQWEC